jgi:hypothetical protein
MVRAADTREFSLMGGRGCYLGELDDVGCYGNDIKKYAETGAILYYQHRIEGAPAGLRSLAQTRAQSCAIDTESYIVCWGGVVNNDGGNIHGSWQSPTRHSDVKARLMAAAESTMCFVKDANIVRCWGLKPPNAWFQPGAIATVTPWDVGDFDEEIAAIEGGGAHLCAVLVDGSLYCWGWNGYGQLGDGSLNDSVEPIRIN